jgi:hypothetical protein
MAKCFEQAANSISQISRELFALCSELSKELREEIFHTQSVALNSEKKPNIWIEPRIMVHDAPPPHPLSDMQYESLSPAQASRASRNPIVIMLMVHVEEKMICLYVSTVTPKSFSARRIKRDLKSTLDNPRSFLWLRLAWLLTPHQIKSIEDLPPSPDEIDPADAWKFGRKPPGE